MTATNESLTTLIEVAGKNAERSEVLAAEVAALNERVTLTNRVLDRLKLLLLAHFAGLIALVALGILNRELLTEQRRTTETIESCTTPGGKCYEEGTARTAEAVKAIVDSNNNGLRDSQEILDALRSNPK